MMVMWGDDNPVVVSICDCTDHMLEGGKKDVTYVAEMFKKEEVFGYTNDDPNRNEVLNLPENEM